MNTEEINKELLGISENLMTLLKNLGYSQSQIKEAINKAADEALITPKVGDWFEAHFDDDYVIGRVTKQEGEKTHFFGVTHKWNNTKWENDWCNITENINLTSLSILTESEVIAFLTKEAEKRYKDGDIVKSEWSNDIITLPYTQNNRMDDEYFIYKGVAVLDLQTGKWAEKVEKKDEAPQWKEDPTRYMFPNINHEDYDVWIHQGKLMIKHDHQFIDGKYKLVKV